MVCNSCGHPNDDHKSVSFSMFYCNQCKQIESSISFSTDGKNVSSDPSKSTDVYTDIYWSFKKGKH